jgi:hypothetical protein
MLFKNMIPLLLYLETTCPTGPEGPRSADFAEFFAGDAEISKHLRAFGFEGFSYDLRHGEFMDILTAVGFLTCLNMVRKLKPLGLAWFAPPCSSWILISRGKTGRNKLRPKGRTNRLANKRQNTLVSRVCCILEYLSKRSVYWVVEQPTSSVMFELARFELLLRRHNARRVSFPMGAYGAESLKPTVLWGTWPGLADLGITITASRRSDLRASRSSADIATTWVNAQGRTRFMGSGGLKRSRHIHRGWAPVWPSASHRPCGPQLSRTLQST